MGINRKFVEAREKLAKEASAKPDAWETIMPRVSQGMVIPIISSSFRIEQIFRIESEDLEGDGVSLPVSEQLISEWSNLIEYPLQDKHNLARVAQYYMVEQKDDPHAKTRFLEFLKSFLLTIASDDKEYADLTARLKSRIHELSFSEIAQQLDFPRFTNSAEDPLRLLARLPLPVYVTTSHSDFIERALEAEGKKPRTQICFWSGEISNISPDHRTNLEFLPNVTTPLVYHLYGFDEYPQTIVLSEDDYLNFLIAMVEDTNTLNPIVPLGLQRALGDSHLILLGYRLDDWDFRVLFRFLLKFRRDDFSPRGMVIQLRENERAIANVEKSLNYLGRYFDRRKFDVEWKNPENFIQKLWAEWNAYRQGQA